jgi:hypothetical protein
LGEHPDRINCSNGKSLCKSWFDSLLPIYNHLSEDDEFSEEDEAENEDPFENFDETEYIWQ